MLTSTEQHHLKGTPEAQGSQKASTYLLHVAQHVFPAVKHPFAFLWVELVNEVSGVIYTAALISEMKVKDSSSLRAREAEGFPKNSSIQPDESRLRVPSHFHTSPLPLCPSSDSVYLSLSS